MVNFQWMYQRILFLKQNILIFKELERNKNLFNKYQDKIISKT